MLFYPPCTRYTFSLEKKLELVYKKLKFAYKKLELVYKKLKFVYKKLELVYKKLKFA